MGALQPHECPRCGAPLPKGSGGSIVCKYCRVTVNLPEQPQPRNPHPARPSSALPPWAKPWLKVETVFAVLIGLGMAGWQLQKHWDMPSAPPPELPDAPPGHSTTGPHRPPSTAVAGEPSVRRIEGKVLLLSGKGDRQMVVAVAAFADSGDDLWLAAWSSEAGRLSWRWPLPLGAHASNTERASFDGSLVVRTAEAVVRLDAETGQVLWQGPAPAPQGRLCATSAYVGVKADRSPTRVLDWATGRPFDVKPRACETLYSSQDAGPNFQYLAPGTLTELRRRPKDFTVVRGLLPKQGNARVVLGTVGSEAAPAVSVTANGRWVWQQEVSAHTAAQLPEPALAAVRRESVVVPFWDVQNHALRLAAFNLTHGARLWEAMISERTPLRKGVELDVGVTLDGAVCVEFDGRLLAYSLATGQLLWSLGGT